jgi:hypothetical protein
MSDADNIIQCILINHPIEGNYFYGYSSRSVYQRSPLQYSLAELNQQSQFHDNLGAERWVVKFSVKYKFIVD